MKLPFRLAPAAARLVGAALLTSGFLKIGDAANFVYAVAAFDILPPVGNAFLAIVLPGWELGSGALLVAGTWTRAAASVAAFLFASFAIAVGSAIVRGISAPCGCFGPTATLSVGPGLLAVDLAGLALAVWVARADASTKTSPRV